MDLKVKLDDERLCGGCPLNTGERQECAAGFKRETAIIVEMQYRRSMPFGFMGMDTERGLGFIPVRPRACLLANERTMKAIETIETKEKEDADD